MGALCSRAKDWSCELRVLAESSASRLQTSLTQVSTPANLVHPQGPQASASMSRWLVSTAWAESLSSPPYPGLPYFPKTSQFSLALFPQLVSLPFSLPSQ